MKIRSGNDIIGAGHFDDDLSPGVATSLDGGTYYVPLSAENWTACLEALRLSLSPHQ